MFSLNSRLVAELICLALIDFLHAADVAGWGTVKTIPTYFVEIATQNVLRCGKLCERQGKCIASTFDNRNRICYMHDNAVNLPTFERKTNGRFLYKRYGQNPTDQDSLAACDRDTEIVVPSARDDKGACKDTKEFQPSNVAVKKRAWQISTHSTFHGGVASKAVDGDRNSVYLDGSCTHTRETVNPWWIVDLNNIYTISDVVIVNRHASADRLHNFTIEVASIMTSDQNFSNFTLCDHYPGKATSSQVLTFGCGVCHPVRYVKIQIFDDTKASILTLCEVEVYRALNKVHCT